MSVKCFHDHAYKGWKYVDLKLKENVSLIKKITTDTVHKLCDL